MLKLNHVYRLMIENIINIFFSSRNNKIVERLGMKYLIYVSRLAIKAINKVIQVKVLFSSHHTDARPAVNNDFKEQKKKM